MSCLTAWKSRVTIKIWPNNMTLHIDKDLKSKTFSLKKVYILRQGYRLKKKIWNQTQKNVCLKKAYFLGSYFHSFLIIFCYPQCKYLKLKIILFYFYIFLLLLLLHQCRSSCTMYIHITELELIINTFPSHTYYTEIIRCQTKESEFVFMDFRHPLALCSILFNIIPSDYI